MPPGESRNEKGRISINVNKRRQADVKDTFFQFAEQTCLCYFFYGKSKGTNLLNYPQGMRMYVVGRMAFQFLI